MNIPFPPKSGGQMVNCETFLTDRSSSLISSQTSSSKSGWLAVNASATFVVSDRVNVQTEKMNFPPGFTLGATLASKFRWISESSRTSSGVVVQRACGLDRKSVV